MTKSIPAIPLAVISLVLIGTLATCAPAAAAPRAEVPETTFDFGKVYEDKELVHTFSITNTGEAPLHIKGIDPDCSCTAADYNRQIPPKGQGKITLTIAPYSVLKKFAKHTKVLVNDPERPEITLTMQGWGLPMIDIEPHHIVRFEGKVGGEFQARVRFVSHLSSPLEIKQITTNIAQDIEVTLTPEVAGKIYVLEVKNKRQEPGRYVGKIELTTNYSQKPRLMVRVFADLAPAPAAKP